MFTSRLRRAAATSVGIGADTSIPVVRLTVATKVGTTPPPVSPYLETVQDKQKLQRFIDQHSKLIRSFRKEKRTSPANRPTRMRTLRRNIKHQRDIIETIKSRMLILDGHVEFERLTKPLLPEFRHYNPALYQYVVVPEVQRTTPLNPKDVEEYNNARPVAIPVSKRP